MKRDTYFNKSNELLVRNLGEIVWIVQRVKINFLNCIFAVLWLRAPVEIDLKLLFCGNCCSNSARKWQSKIQKTNWMSMCFQEEKLALCLNSRAWTVITRTMKLDFLTWWIISFVCWGTPEKCFSCQVLTNASWPSKCVVAKKNVFTTRFILKMTNAVTSTIKYNSFFKQWLQNSCKYLLRAYSLQCILQPIWNGMVCLQLLIRCSANYPTRG
mgnify:CR=1 FL=1